MIKTSLATSIKYGNYKYLQPRAALVFKWIKQYWDDFKDYFDFDNDVEFHVRPCSRKYSRVVSIEEQENRD